MCVCLRARSRIHTHTHQVWTPPQGGCCGGAYCRPRLDAPSSSPRTRWRRRKACVTGSESLWMDGFAVSASPPASRAAMVACSCSRLSALLHARTHTHTHTYTHTYTHKRPCSSMVPSGCGNHTPIDALTLLIIMPFYRPRADRRGSRQGCPGPQTGGEAVAALSQHLLPCRHVHLRAAGTRHKAVAGVRGHDRRPQGEAATEAPCRNSDAVHASCFVQWCMWFTAAAGRRRLADPQSKLRDASPPSPLSHTQAQVLTSWGISSCTLEDAFIKIAQQGAENAQLPPSAAALGTVGQQGRCLPSMLRFAKNRQGN